MDKPPRLITRWTRRDARLPPALAPGAVRLDSRGFGDRVIDAVELARTIGYPVTKLDGGGDWGDLLLADPAVLLAEIIGSDPDAQGRKMRDLMRRLRAAREEHRLDILSALVAHAIDLARRADRWFAMVDTLYLGDGAPTVHAVVDDAAMLLGRAMQRLIAALEALERERGWRSDLLVLVERFHSRWRLAITVEIDRREAALAGEERVADAVEELLAASERIVAEAEQAFTDALASSDHQPHVTLLFAYLTLAAHAGERLDALPGAIARLYHEQMLGLAANPAIADRVWLAFTRIRYGGGGTLPSPPVVPEGLIVSPAPKAPAATPRFAIDADLTVSGVRLGELRVWSATGGIDRITPAADGTLTPGAQPVAPPPIGVILTGPGLRAESGKRWFTVTLTLSGVRWPAATSTDGFAGALTKGVALAVKTGDDWIAIDRFETAGSSIDPAVGNDCGTRPGIVAIRFTLDPAFPAMAETPMLRMLVEPQPAGQDDTPALHDALARARVTTGSVTLEVTGAPGLPAPDTESAPFGAIAAQGEAFAITHPAFARGDLDRVALTLHWAALPPHPDGFAGYYRDYVVGLDRRVRAADEPLYTNAVFQARFSAPLASGTASVEAPLFTQDDKGALNTVSWFELVSPSPASDPGPGLVKSDVAPPSEIAGATLELTGPAYAFGDLLYPVNVAYAIYRAGKAAAPPPAPAWWRRLLALLLAFAKAPVTLATLIGQKVMAAVHLLGGKPALPVAPPPAPAAPPAATAPIMLMPNVPWRPVVTDALLDYVATIPVGQDDGALRLTHWTSFDGDRPPTGDAVGIALLPETSPPNCLELWFEGEDPSLSLSLLLAVSQPAAVPVRWWSLGTAGQWIPVEAACMVDGTAGLTRSGILRMTGQPRALRAVVQGAAPVVLVALPDAQIATRLLGDEDAPSIPLKPGDIATIDGVRGIAQVLQPLASFGGYRGEKSGDVAARAGERVRHKGRGILAWDDERLILDRFPEIAAVRVMPACGPDGAALPGGVLALIVTGDDKGMLTPTTPALRDTVQAMLSAKASAFAAITVTEATPCRIDIHADVVCLPGDAERLEADLRDHLSPIGRDRLDLPDAASLAALRGALVRFIRSRPYVDAVADVRVTVATPPSSPDACLRPVAGDVEIALFDRSALRG